MRDFIINNGKSLNDKPIPIKPTAIHTQLLKVVKEDEGDHPDNNNQDDDDDGFSLGDTLNT